MNISTFAIAVGISVASLQAVAQSVILKPVNQDFETLVCQTAATEGYAAAKRQIRENQLNVSDFKNTVTCNGVDLKTFAAMYADNTVTEDAKTIKLVAKDTTVASKACIAAISIGEEAALAQFNLEGENILCNYKEMAEFIRQYDSENMVTRVITEE